MEEALGRCHGNHFYCGFPFTRMPWKGVSSFHLQGDESALPILPALQGQMGNLGQQTLLPPLLWSPSCPVLDVAIVTREQMKQ